MSFCTSCGAQLGFGRFCTNCGAPMPGQEPTPADQVDATQVRLPRVQPDAATGPRFPLYADATDPVPRPQDSPGTTNPTGMPPVTAAPTPASAPPYPTAAPAAPTAPATTKRSRWPWIVLALVLLLAAGGGAWAVLDDDETTDAAGADSTSDTTPAEPSESTDASPTQPSESTTPDPPDVPEGDPVDLVGEAEVSAPRPRPPGQTATGTPVRYPATNMLDGDPTTSYQISGDASGSVITFSFDSPVTLREVGMINGYAKSEGGNDWYAKNRKVLEAEWSFDDGTSVSQRLRRTTDLQVLAVEPTTTQTVTLRLVKVSKPGPDPRDNTAISSILLRGNR